MRICVPCPQRIQTQMSQCFGDEAYLRCWPSWYSQDCLVVAASADYRFETGIEPILSRYLQQTWKGIGAVSRRIPYHSTDVALESGANSLLPEVCQRSWKRLKIGKWADPTKLRSVVMLAVALPPVIDGVETRSPCLEARIVLRE